MNPQATSPPVAPAAPTPISGGATQAFAVPKPGATPTPPVPNTPYEPSEYTRMMAAQKPAPASSPLAIPQAQPGAMPQIPQIGQMPAIPQVNFPPPAMQMPQMAVPQKNPPNMLLIGILVLLALLLIGVIVLLVIRK